MKTNVLFSLALHAVLVAALFTLRGRPDTFEGYPVVIPVEIVKMEPVSFKAPEVEKIVPRQQRVKPKPKKLEGVTVEKPKIVEEEPEEQPEEDTCNQAAVALSKLGASKGGRARAQSLSKKRRKEIARKAAKVRWS